LKIRVTAHGRTSPGALKSLVIKHETRSQERFSDLALDELSIVQGTLNECEFDKVRVRSANFGSGRTQSTLRGCAFRNCRLVFGAIGNARLVDCTFESCTLEHIFGTQLEMIGCSFPNTTIRKAVFHGTVFEPAQMVAPRARNEFTRNDFSSATFRDVDFRGGIDLLAQRLPTGEDYLLIRDTCQALAVARQLEQTIVERDELERCRSLMTTLDARCSGKQASYLWCVEFWGAFAKELAARLRE
jgi:hypothetical protein